MEYFPLVMTDQDRMIVQMIRQFVDKEIMPVRDKIDDDIDHVLITKILTKLADLGVFRVQAPADSAEGGGPGTSLVTSCAVLEEMSRGFGHGRFRTFREVVLPQLRPALAAGGLLVALYAISDFGAVSLLRLGGLGPGV